MVFTPITYAKHSMYSICTNIEGVCVVFLGQCGHISCMDGLDGLVSWN